MRLIDADALSELLVKTYETAPTEKALLFVALLLKNNEQVPTVSDRYDEGYAQGYIDGSTGADWKGGAENENNDRNH